jgi:ribosome-binding ATPase YchF (GTP1/OBG family)
MALSFEERQHLKNFSFLTDKTVVYAANVAEEDLPSMDNLYVQQVKEHAKKEGCAVVSLCAKWEEELSAIEDAEMAQELLQAVGLKERALNQLIRTSFEKLGLITFLTTGEMETRAWTITKGTTAQQAAGKIHTDIQKGFIRAEVVTFEDMIHYGGRVQAREAGKARSEGKDYLVQDGDVILFYHN